MNTKDMTPTEIDNLWLPLEAECRTHLDRAASYAKYAAEAKYDYDRDTYTDSAAAATAKAKAIAEQMKPFKAEWDARNGWTRYWLVTNTNGHAHRTLHCGTCYLTTQYAPLTALAGKTDEEVVEALGSDACTVCFPDAPVEALTKPRSVFTADEAAAAAERAERQAKTAAKKAKAAAAAITTRDGGALKDANGWAIKTEQTAWNTAVSYVFDARYFRYNGHADEVAAIIDALAAKNGKTVAEITAMVEAKVAAKAKREHVA